MTGWLQGRLDRLQKFGGILKFGPEAQKPIQTPIIPSVTKRLQNSLKLTVMDSHEFTYNLGACPLCQKKEYMQCPGWAGFRTMPALIGLITMPYEPLPF